MRRHHSRGRTVDRVQTPIRGVPVMGSRVLPPPVPPPRQRTSPGTTAVYAPHQLPVSPRPLSGRRRAQLMDVYVRLLEERAWGVEYDQLRVLRVLSVLRRRLGRG